MSFQSIPIEDLKYSQVFFSLKVPRGGIIFLYLIVLLLISGCIYAVFGSIDEWARGTALLRPEHEVSIVRNETPGRIAARQASHGDLVTAGEVLWTVDTGAAQAEIESLEAELRRLRNDRSELSVLVESLTVGENLIPESLPHARMQLELLQLEKRRRELQLLAARRAYEREDQAPSSLRRADRVEELLRSYELLEIETKQFIPRELVSRQEQLRSLEGRISEIEQTLLASRRRLSAASVLAPISGTLEFVRDFVIGEYVSTGEELARIVPEQADRFRLVIEIPEREASELVVGQELVLRFSGFPVAEYGSVRGRLSYIPQDAEGGADGSPVYRVRGELEHTTIYDKDGQSFPLRPGMTAEARVITRQTPIYRFLLRKLDFLL
ncbi:HlyD family efflux transporter periplasmic adaptor subunit [Spirochaeta dissipatitropha]